MWRLSGELAVNCSTLVDLPRQTHGLRWMRDELMAPPDHISSLEVCLCSVTGSWSPDIQPKFSVKFRPSFIESIISMHRLGEKGRKHRIETDGKHPDIRTHTQELHNNRSGFYCQSACLLKEITNQLVSSKLVKHAYNYTNVQFRGFVL